jgi:DNA-binding transcriptional ArsR family regulator
MSEGPTERDGVRISDPRVMRALAHPARIDIVDYLTNTGEAVTATQCAGMVGLSPSATSYHLRELAKFGLVEQAPSRGDGRERLWRSAGGAMRIKGDSDEPDALQAERAVLDAYLTRDFEQARKWAARAGTQPPEWQEASVLMGFKALVTADEMVEINNQVQALLEPYRMRDRRGSEPSGARQVFVRYLAFPDET